MARWKKLHTICICTNGSRGVAVWARSLSKHLGKDFLLAFFLPCPEWLTARGVNSDDCHDSKAPVNNRSENVLKSRYALVISVMGELPSA